MKYLMLFILFFLATDTFSQNKSNVRFDIGTDYLVSINKDFVNSSNKIILLPSFNFTSYMSITFLKHFYSEMYYNNNSIQLINGKYFSFDDIGVLLGSNITFENNNGLNIALGMFYRNYSNNIISLSNDTYGVTAKLKFKMAIYDGISVGLVSRVNLDLDQFGKIKNSVQISQQSIGIAFEVNLNRFYEILSKKKEKSKY